MGKVKKDTGSSKPKSDSPAMATNQTQNRDMDMYQVKLRFFSKTFTVIFQLTSIIIL